MSAPGSIGNRSDFFLALSVSLLCFISTYFILGFYYTDYQAFASGLFSSKLTPGVQFRSLYFIANIGTSYIYSYLYQFFSNIEWLSWVYGICSFFACFLGLFTVASLLPANINRSVKAAILIGVYFLVFADNQMHFNCTYIAYMVCGASLLGLFCFFRSAATIKLHWPLFLLLNLFFTMGTLTKLETGTASSLLIAFFGVFYLRSIKQCIVLLLYPLLLVTALSAGVSMEIKNSKEFYLQIEPDIESQFENRNNKVPLSVMKTHRDTILYNTASDIVWSDPAVISPEYLRSLIMPEKLMFTDARQWNRVLKNIYAVAAKYWYLVLINFFLGLVLVFKYDFRRYPFSRLYWLAFELSFWVLIGAQTYVYKLNDRSFTPFISLFIFCHLLLVLANIRYRMSALIILIFPFILAVFGTRLYYLINESGNLREDLVRYQTNFEKIKKVAAGSYLVINSSSTDYFCLSNVPFRPFDFSAFKKVYITDGSVIPFVPYYRRYLEKECNCDMYAYPSFYNYLRSVHNQVIIVSAPDRMEIIKNYLWEIHRFELHVQEVKTDSLVPMEKDENRDYFDELRMYRLQE